MVSSDDTSRSKTASVTRATLSKSVFVPCVAVAVAAAVYSMLALRRVQELRAGAFDAGFVDNVLYKIAAGLGGVTGLTGVSHFVDHAAPLMLFAVPIYWVSASHAYEVLLVVQAVSVAMVGLAAWLIADTIGLSRGRRYAVLAFALLSPAAYWAIINDFHMTGLSMGLVAMTVAGAYRRWRIRYYWLLPLLTSLARFEIAVTVVIVGLLLLGVSRHHARATMVVGIVVSALVATFMIASPEQGSSIGAHFGYLAVESAKGLPLALLKHPLAVVQQILAPLFLVSLGLWAVIIGLVLPLKAPRWLLVGVPMLAVAGIGSWAPADAWYEHYWNLLFVGAVIGVVVSLAVWSWSDRTVLLFVAATLVGAWALPVLVYNPPGFRLVYPAASPDEHRAATAAATSEGALAAPWELVLPGAHREWVYRFPNPFVCRSPQSAYFVRSGPVPDVVITGPRWEHSIMKNDLPSIRRMLATDYQVTDVIGEYTIRRILPGADPPMVDECHVATMD